MYAENTRVQSSGPLSSQPRKALVALNQNADEDSYTPSPISPGFMALVVMPEALARKTAR